MQEIGAIRDWHAHVYFDPATRMAAAALREGVGARFPEAVLGRWHEEPVGPHPRSMYQIAFTKDDFPALVSFVALNRAGLTVLVHPNTARPKDDHLKHALWMGSVLSLDAGMLPEVAKE
ncbi:MAG TPA: DOPA 4,5-dioxygenase family protein [Acetobacteraceae bacterium]|jgi:DOPA 4,5-dioxygenase